MLDISRSSAEGALIWIKAAHATGAIKGDAGQREIGMRMRALLRMMSLGTVAALLPVLAYAPALRAAPLESEGQVGALPTIKSAILKSTGYADATVTLTLRASQFWVTIENSRLNDGTARHREAQAARIASAITDKVKGGTAFVGILAIHIDYVVRSKDGSHNDILDSIDFRKGPDETFTHQRPKQAVVRGAIRWPRCVA